MKRSKQIKQRITIHTILKIIDIPEIKEIQGPTRVRELHQTPLTRDTGLKATSRRKI